ncbi:MAG: response regulator [Halieaceae bacterium]|jgi:DNA-binding NtrC family response regulator|nr:response regulator [Halieaceae bacterium]
MPKHDRILVVDDEPVILEELCELLDTMDYDATCANSVDAALEKVEADPRITLVITDMRMPGKDGVELVRQLSGRKDREFEFLVISGHLDSDAEMAGLSRLPVKRMRKPINFEEIMNFLEGLDFEQ